MPTRTKTPMPKPQAQPAKDARKPKSKIVKFKPAPDWIKELFANAINYFPETEPRKMFGYPCAFVKGNMMCGVFADRLMIRLSEADRARFLNLPGAKQFEPMPGRPMKEYVEVPEAILRSPELKKWLKKSLAYAQSLPVKKKK